MNQTYWLENPHRPETLVQMVRDQAALLPDHKALIFLRDGEQQEISLTYAELDRRARSIAAWLQQENLDGGQALLLYPPGLDFLTTFFGCLYAGVVAVPVYPPRLNRPSPRVQAVVADSQVTVALTTTKIYQGLERRFSQMPGLAALRWLDTESMTDGLHELWRDPSVKSDNLAFLQYTSGSTGSPKGVMLSHANLLHNLEIIRRGFRITPESVGVSWLPSYHDMGLIGGILEPLYVPGIRNILMAPAAFLQRPVRWLQAISHYRADISGAPNFAYQLCVDHTSAEQREGLNLSSWRVAYCGAEPIRRETLDNFTAAFTAQGFQRKAFYPCYGLAEGTLIVSGGSSEAEPTIKNFQAHELAENHAVPLTTGGEGSVSLVGCGSASLGQEIRIVNPESMMPSPDNDVGEIWLSGESVARGYWQRPEITEQIFRAHLANSGEGPFLRTGDLGFIHEEELYVTGRLKDIIIIHGRNHYPQDIEHTVGKCHPALAEGKGAAFSITEDGEEKLVIVNEVTRRHRKPNINAVVVAIRRAVAHEHQLQVYAVVLIKPLSVPQTSSGKIIRHACKRDFLEEKLKVVGQWRANQEIDFAGEATTPWPEKAVSKPDAVDAEAAGADAEAIAAWLAAQLAQRLRINARSIDARVPFVDLGLDSVLAISIVGELETWLGRSLSPTLIWDFPTIEDLAQHLAGEQPQHEMEIVAEREREPIAVIGLGCRFPGADSPDAFWQFLQGAGDGIVEVPATRWDRETFYASGPEPTAGKMSTKWGGFLDQVDQFDATFFGISPREATRMDPQQRLLLEVTWEALERAGQNPGALAGSATGVFIGISSSDYSWRQYSQPELIDAYAATGNAHSVAANRLSYSLDLHGPSIAIDTACSSSLVATHMAMNSLLSGESDVALAGGVNLLLEPDLTITFSQARMMAADGRCKTFDARADGYVRGEGCGVVVLKRLSDAERDGDPIVALLHGSAVNQDGRSNGLTAPNGLSQQAVIRRALAAAGVDASAVSYVEAHGTGTRLGDPIEIHSLQAVVDGQEIDQPLVVGSVKTNFGHLEAAAGVAGLIKTILALEHEQIPAHLHFQQLNPHINLVGSRLRISAEATPWPRGAAPRLAGVSSFGFGGTNAHIIVGEAPPRVPGEEGPGQDLFTLSARDEQALGEMAAGYAAFLEQNPALRLADICYAANTGRATFNHRLAMTAGSSAELRRKLNSYQPLQTWKGLAGSAQVSPAQTELVQGSQRRVAFLFAGQGAQYEGMGRLLYEREPVFRAVLERCAAILAGQLDQPLLDVIYPGKDRPSADIAAVTLVDQTRYTQLALFAVEFALAELWRSWGIVPDVVMGHSVGEYVAACVAGAMSLEDGLKLIAARARLMGELPAGGAMAALFASEAQVAAAAAPYQQEISIAAINGPASVVVSGTEAAVAAVVAQLAQEGIESRPLVVSHAFHSPLMDPILEPFRSIANEIEYKLPQIPLVSNLSGQLRQEAPDAGYWVQHVRQPVRFSAGMQTLAESGATIFLEVGPEPHLTSMGKRVLKATDPHAASSSLWLPSLGRKSNDREKMLNSLGRLFVAGLDVDWSGFYRGTKRQKIALPTYPFQRERYWFDVPGDGMEQSRMSAGRERTLSTNRYGRGRPSSVVHRLPTAVPLFESWLDLHETADKMDLMHKNSLAVAHLFWGEGAHQVTDLSLSGRLLSADEPVLSQTTLSMTAADSATFQTFGGGKDEDSWHLLAGGQLRRGPVVAVQPQAAEPAATVKELLPNSSSSATAYEESQLLLSASADEQHALAIRYLQTRTTAVLDLDRSRVNFDQPLDTLGMDSLMAIELKNHLQRDLEVDLPVVELLQGPTIDQLADLLITILAEPAVDAAIKPLTAEGEPGPLSYGQQAMWVLHQLLPAEVSFNVAGAARLQGDFDVRAFTRAMQRLVHHHGSLRTTFTVTGGIPAQVVHPQASAWHRDEIVTIIAAAGWDQETLDSFLQREAYRAFDLENGPLLRVVLLKREAQDHILLIALNHLITDFWSMSLLVQDIMRLYAAELAGDPLSLAPIELHTADYARWQAEMLAGDESDQHRQYWHKQLAGKLSRLDLPTDRPRSSEQTFAGGMESRHFDGQLTAKLKTLSAAHGATLATTLLASFQTLLYRYTGQEDFLVGTVIAGRERPELRDVVGYFINSIALRADFSMEQDEGAGPAFVDVLAQTRRAMLDAITHQDYPLPLLAEELAANGNVSLDPSRPPLFETMFIMQRAQVMDGQGLSAFALGVPGAKLDLEGLSVESLPFGGLPAQFDLTLMIAQVDGGLTAALHYNTHLFDPQTMQRMLAHLEQLLVGISADLNQPVKRIPLLPQHEREQLLGGWNATAAPYPREKTLHELVTEQAQSTPHEIAVSFADQHWTYAQLEGHANHLAHHLRQMGVGSGSLVALYVDRSLDMMAGILGILKAGGAYIPLDPDFPVERLSLMLEDAQPTLLLTQMHLADNIERPAGTPVYLIDGERDSDSVWDEERDGGWERQIAPVPGSNGPEGSLAGPQDLAYVIYTSGSTGKPKGVQISHRAAVNFLWSMRQEPGLSAADHLLAVTTLSFDIALLELFLPLISGARVTIAPREIAMDGYQLGHLIDREGITVMQATPATWQLLLEAGWQGKDDLMVLCGGEALQPTLAQQLLARCSVLWNMYGPTETTVWSAICRIRADGERITIGRPIANTEIYILDQQMQPVPIGMAGDLYIGGDGLSYGYLNRPQLTRERFVPNPFANGQMLYKTGDLARMLADGRILFLGRDDFQVKIRGYRIELGDIEAALARHPAVAQNVCTAPEQTPDQRQLVAYVVSRADQAAPTPLELRAFLRAQLPDYMIPAHFIALEALPLLPNGKIDRRALPALDDQRERSAAVFAPPRDELEEQVAEIAAYILDLEEISIHDSFFDLGGNSLLATRLIFQTREQFQVQIPLRQLFLEPTVAGLSQAIVKAQTNGHASGNGYHQVVGTPRDLPLRDDAHLYSQMPQTGAITLAELQAEAALDPAITAAGLPLAEITVPRHILLTGATGFVGAFLVRDLLQDTEATIHCLVRAADDEAALARVRQNMTTYGLWEESYVERISGLAGDLGRSQFGLSGPQFAFLAHAIDIIIHNGALVNFVYSYREHRAPNVLGTQEVLRLACREKLKAVHFVSTLSVFHTGRHDDGQVFYEQDDLDEIGVPFGGYAQSKWVGEKMTMAATERGIPAAIYRPGLVAGDSDSGVWNTADMMSTLTMASTAVGAVPDLDVNVDIVPVDYVSKAIITLALQSSPAGKIFNICNPQTMPYQEVLDLIRAAGLPLRAMPFDQWRDMLVMMAQQLDGKHWNPYLPLLDEVTAEQVFMPAFDCAHTLEGLAGTGVVCPPVGRELLQTYITFLQLDSQVVR